MLKTVITAVAALSLSATFAFADGSGCATGTYNFGKGCVKPSPEQGLELLLKGNAAFAKGDLSTLLKYSQTTDRTEVAAGQKPFAIVLTCSDSRLPAEILFNKGLGEIFVVRVAGNIVAPHELGSIEYALEHLDANLIVVLGHERCGAVKTTYGVYPAHLDAVADGGKMANLASLTESIYPAVDAVVKGTKPADATAQAAQLEECIVDNINKVSESLETKSIIIKEFVEGFTNAENVYKKAKIVRAKYDLDSGLVKVLEEAHH